MKTVIILLLIILTVSRVSDLKAEKPQENPQARLERVVIPYLLYTSETGFLVGIAGSLSLNDLSVKNDNFSLLAASQYTQKNQTVTSLIPRYRTEDNDFQTELNIGYKYWPAEFYGTGIDSSKDDLEDYVSKELEFYGYAGKRFSGTWNIGLVFNYARFALEFDEEAALLSSGLIKGSKGGKLSGSGIALISDRRNSIFFTTSGAFFDLRAVFYNRGLGSDFSYQQYSMDLRQYYTLSEKRSVSFQLFSGFQTDGVPFQKMFRLGDFLRAYLSPRYIDKNITIARAEYRYFPWEGRLSERIGLVLFAETGSVFYEFNDWSINDQKISLGGGFRFRLIKGDGVMLRCDIGLSPESANIIFIGMEAF